MTKPSQPSSWVIIPKAQYAARLRLFCLPYAGGSSSAFRTWPETLGPEIEVAYMQLPGHGSRHREAALTRAHTAASQLAGAIQDYLDMPYAIFGQSLGGLIGFELVRELRRRALPEPVHLFVCARPAPQLVNDWSPMHILADDLMVKEVQRRYGGIPQSILSDAELRQLFLPVLRADLEILETYEYVPEAPLGCDITVYGGYQDWAVTDAQLSLWAEQTVGAFSQQMFPGNHFFVQNTQSFMKAFSSALTTIGLMA